MTRLYVEKAIAFENTAIEAVVRQNMLIDLHAALSQHVELDKRYTLLITADEEPSVYGRKIVYTAELYPL